MEQLFINRLNMYHFLSRLYILEVDSEMLQTLKDMSFPQATGEYGFDEGYECIRAYLSGCADNMLDELAVDYAAAFLAAGVAQGLAAFPYESIYTGKKRLMMQEATRQVSAWYEENGLGLGSHFPKVAEDHIAAELEFMAFLCQKNIESKNFSDMSEQKAFFMQHMNSWIPTFSKDLEKYADTLFYKGLAKITNGFMKREAALFQALEG